MISMRDIEDYFWVMFVLLGMRSPSEMVVSEFPPYFLGEGPRQTLQTIIAIDYLPLRTNECILCGNNIVGGSNVCDDCIDEITIPSDDGCIHCGSDVSDGETQCQDCYRYTHGLCVLCGGTTIPGHTTCDCSSEAESGSCLQANEIL